MAMAVRRRILTSISRRLFSGFESVLFSPGRDTKWMGSIKKFSKSAALEEFITPPVQISYTKHLIDGRFVDAVSGKTFPTVDPRTGEIIAQVAEGDAEDINRAVSAARRAFDDGPWPRMPAYVHSSSFR